MFVPPLLSVLLVDEVDDDALESAAGVGVAATALGLSFVNYSKCNLDRIRWAKD